MKKSNFEPLAIVGYGCVFPPDSYDTEKFWDNIITAKPGVDEMPESSWKKELYYDKDRHTEDKTYCKLGAYVKNYEFPKVEEKLNLNKGKIEGLNRSQLMLLDTIIQSLKKGNISIDELNSNDVSMVVGNMLGDYSFSNECLINKEKQIEYYLDNNEKFKKLSESEKESIKKSLKEEIENRFSNGKVSFENKAFHSNLCKGVADILNIKGREFIVDGACSGSLLAVDNAVKILHSGKAKTCVVAGVLGNMIVTGNIAFAKVGGLAENGSFPLDIKANGLVPGEGVGTIIIKRLSDAVKENNKIYGVIRGTGVASDGKGKSIYAPSSIGQYKAMKKSLDEAGVNPLYVDYVETHATGTKVGDIVELNGLKMLFEEDKITDKKIIIGSIKSQVGHCFSAAGMANLIKVIEGFNRELLPPTNYFERFADEFEMGKVEFSINTKLQKWEKKESTPKAALINAFGFGGINANVLVKEYNADYHKQLLDSNNKSLENSVDVSIVGIGCMDGNGSNYEEWCKNTSSHFQYLTKFPKDRYQKEINNIYNQDNNLKASFIDNFKFPCIKFKIPPVILGEIDRAQQLALIASHQAIESYGKDKIVSDKTGVFIGNMLGLERSMNTDLRIRHREYLDVLENITPLKNINKDDRDSILNDITNRIRKYIPKTEEDTLPGYMDNIIAGRVSNFFNLTSSNAVYDSDKISFEQALEVGIISLQTKENDLVLVGGVNGNMSPEFIELLKKLDVKSNVIPAEGVAAFLIKRTEDVTEDDHVYARITGIKFNPGNSTKRDDVYEISEETLSEDGNSMFYYGAQGAFQLLKACDEINNNDKKYVKISSKSISNGSYEVNVQASDAEVLIDEDITSNAVNCFKTCANSVEELIRKLDCKEASSEEDFKKFNYRISIIYNTDQELESKIKNSKNLLVKGWDE
ncbi:Beta-ketoacyl synthase, N-terminal domain [Clostridium sp. DSM 8431]|uniref:beta-ketoacyl synthase N-terminal-like domain-containing protein n=1 Tax=Clostridium sp. DSM 8431 TaxID=1761781 RepID=UPI0008E985C4|nr:beta-ketoacyl synthase N-terminal-like domain-containing protein [Clostridium sp. DSM 8431]SFU71420.1 Beta-ketoacyl synthase, N-terminal domain [Clostridium sp. DSM 8431]